ncbi:TonB-dependent receptor [uncultured Algimonas sp.]|uniref:TonB-dependent receptor n=1 Tax=uncultured Algimonas sp. TaxID=1547920 RepID=UPI00262F27B1|nr:TonB-dependent receptor [uncultured Algimonas sp.]
MTGSFAGRASALALIMALGASSAFAQDRTSSSDVFMDEVVTTATKSADVETVQDVPVAVTALSADTLEALKVRDLEQLAFAAPNVTLDDIGTSRGTANFSIRGLGVNSSIPSIDPTVGVFQDGVYLGVNTGVVFDIFDLESVEVLRGPQGLLFGRNTTGGAVLINTTNPTDEMRYRARFAVESPLDGDRGGPSTYAMGTLTGPIVAGKLNGKIAAYYNKDDGYFRNGFDGSNHGKAQTYILRGGLEWRVTPDFTLNAKGEYFDSDGDGPAAQNRGLFERDSFDFSIDEPGSYRNRVYNGTIRADWDVAFGNGQITNIFGYRQLDANTLGDIDSSPFDVFHSTTQFEQEQFSNELRYNGTFGAAEVTTGLYWFDQDVAYDEVRFLFRFAGAGAPPTFYGGGQQSHQVLGAFVNVDYAIADNFILTAGLRYSDEEKDAGITYVQPRLAPCSIVAGTCPFDGLNFTGAPNGYTDDDSWSNWTPKLGAQYFFDDDWQAYATYTKGFRSGGYNFRITNVPVFLAQVAANGGQFSFDEEEVDAFELGTKWTSDDRRVNVNAAGFYTDISDMQREVNVSDPAAGVLQNIINTADASILGFEVDGRFTLSDMFTLTGNLGVIDAEYDDVRADISGDGVVSAADLALDLPRVPEATYGFGGIVDVPTGERGLVTMRGNFQHRDRFAYTDSNLGWVQALDRLDASLTYSIENRNGQRISISAFGRNLLDEVQVGGDTQLPGTFAAPYGGQYPRQTGQPVPFADNPQFGTFSPLKKGKVFGIELNIEG